VASFRATRSHHKFAFYGARFVTISQMERTPLEVKPPHKEDAQHCNAERLISCPSCIKDELILPHLACLSSRELNVFKFNRIAIPVLNGLLSHLEAEGDRPCST